MKITEIRLDRTKSLGNYENLKLGFTATVEETESSVEAIERLKDLLDWEINKEERDAQYAKYLKQIENGELNGNQAAVEAWMVKYEARRGAVNAMGVAA